MKKLYILFALTLIAILAVKVNESFCDPILNVTSKGQIVLTPIVKIDSITIFGNYALAQGTLTYLEDPTIKKTITANYPSAFIDGVFAEGLQALQTVTGVIQ